MQLELSSAIKDFFLALTELIKIGTAALKEELKRKKEGN